MADGELDRALILVSGDLGLGLVMVGEIARGERRDVVAWIISVLAMSGNAVDARVGRTGDRRLPSVVGGRLHVASIPDERTTRLDIGGWRYTVLPM